MLPNNFYEYFIINMQFIKAYYLNMTYYGIMFTKLVVGLGSISASLSYRKLSYFPLDLFN